MLTFLEFDSPTPTDSRFLGRTLGSLSYVYDARLKLTCRRRGEGEYCVKGVDIITFDNWANKHPDYPYPIQYSDKNVVVNVMLPPHDGAAGAFIQQMLREVDQMCHPVQPKVLSRTGRINPKSRAV